MSQFARAHAESAGLEFLPNSALLGHTGFVGGNLKEQAYFTDLYNSRNLGDIVGKSYDTIVCATIPAVKWLAIKEPENDKRIIEDIQSKLAGVKCKHFVLISTIDVHTVMTNADEDADNSDNAKHHAYGRHRWEFEQFISKTFENHTIVRLPALFGKKLKKNYLYDLLNDNLGAWIKPNTRFQWYPLKHLWADINTVIAHNAKAKKPADVVRCVNLFPEPLHTCDIVDALFPEMWPRLTPMPADMTRDEAKAKPDFVYDLQTKHASMFGRDQAACPYVRTADDVMAAMREFVAAVRHAQQPAQRRSRLCVSNIAWREDQDDEVLAMLKAKGVTILEIAPTRIAPKWEDITPAAVEAYKRKMADAGMLVAAFQAIMYNQPELKLMTDDEDVRERMHAHVRFCVDLARSVTTYGGGRLVFGAPKARQSNGHTLAECDAMAKAFFTRAGKYAASQGVVIAMEANPAVYAADHMNTSVATAAMVRAVDTPGYRLHLDTACMALAGDDVATMITQNADIMAHMHVSMPWLGTFPTDGGAAAVALDVEADKEPQKKRRRTDNIAKTVGSGADEAARKANDDDVDTLKQTHVPHAVAAAALAAVGDRYTGLLSIEKRNNEDDSVKRMREAVDFVQRVYAVALTTKAERQI